MPVSLNAFIDIFVRDAGCRYMFACRSESESLGSCFGEESVVVNNVCAVVLVASGN